MKISKIAFRPVVRAHEKGVFIGYANVTIEFAPDVALTLYNVECNVWDDNGFAVRTPRHQAERNGRWYSDALLSPKFRDALGNALLRDRVISAAAEQASEFLDDRLRAQGTAPIDEPEKKILF